MSPPAGCRIATGSRNEFLTDIAPEETLVLKGEEECREFKVIVENSPAVPQEGTVREVGAAPGPFVYISKALAGREVRPFLPI